MPESLAPITPDERISQLDLLRGWAMFGVLWSNLNDWYKPVEPVRSLDHALSWTQDYLLESRFYSLLIILFGIGFGLQLARAANKGTDLRITYYRRSAVLLAIGVIHGMLIWSGDILTIYALVSFALVMFRTTSTRGLVAWAAFFWFVGPTIVREAEFLSGLQIMLPGSSNLGDSVYAHLSWWHLTPYRIEGYSRWLGRWGLTSFMTILAAFLMGLWTVKSGYLRRVFEEPRATRRLLVVSLVGAALGFAEWHWGATLWPRPQAPAGFVPHFPYLYYQLNMLRGFVLGFINWDTEGTAIAYACVLLLIWQRPIGQRLLRPLAAAGRMALTTYLTQSIVSQWLFMGMGLSWYGRVGYTRMFEVTIVLFSVQMAISMWWLKRFRYGPAEWAWRWLTYGRAPEMRVAVSNAESVSA